MAAIEAKRAPVCVGIDPVIERVPSSVMRAGPCQCADIHVMLDFCRHLINSVCSFVPCVKLQAACFERYKLAGFDGLFDLVAFARSCGVEVILDWKRGDIGTTAEHYAAAAFEDYSIEPPTDSMRANRYEHAQSTRQLETHRSPDWLTINSYLGEDGITPFLRRSGHGAFALVRTSNAGGDQVQNLELRDGRTVAQAVGEMVARIGKAYIGSRGYSALGAVVGATKPHDARRLREIMPQQIFLVPGYGAQGGGLEDVLSCFKPDGSGAIVTASRSIIYAFEPDDPKWEESVADASAKFADQVGRAVGLR